MNCTANTKIRPEGISPYQCSETLKASFPAGFFVAKPRSLGCTAAYFMLNTRRNTLIYLESNVMSDKQLPHLVFGGQVSDPQGLDFKDVKKLDIVGIFPNYKEAENAWRSASHANVDDAMTKYVIVHLHRLLDPSQD